MSGADSNSTVVISDYDPQWPALYKQEVQLLYDALGAVILELHHIGSTSIPGLVAKPIIDILGSVLELDFVDSKRGPLETIGYMWMGEYGIPGRRYFVKYKPSTKVDMVHLHIFVKENEEVRKNLFFRDYLRKYPAAAREYGTLKQNLAKQFTHDRDRYQHEKGPFIKLILEKI